MILQIEVYEKMIEKMNTKIVITAIICITLLEALALSKGINGILLTTVIAILAGLTGLVIPTPKKLKGEIND